MAEQSDIDHEALQRLVTLGGEKLVHRIVGLFSSFGVARIEDAERAAAAGDMVGVASAAHALRSTAGNVGAIRLLSVVTDLEHTARAHKVEQVNALVIQVRELYDSARMQLLGPVFGGLS